MKLKSLDSLSSKSIKYFIITIVGVLFSISLNLLLANEMLPVDYGFYSYTIAFFTLIAIPCQLGFPTLLVKNIPIYKANCNLSLKKGVIIFSIFSALLLSFIAIILIFIFIENVNLILDLDRGLYSYSLLLILLISLTGVLSAILRACNSPVLSIIPVSLIRPVILLLSIFISSLFLNKSLIYNFNFIINFYIVSLLISVAILLCFVLFINNDIWNSRAEYNSIEWIKDSIPMLMISSVAVISDNLPIIILNNILDLNSVAEYRIGVLGGSILSFVILSFSMVYMPTISLLFKEKRMVGIQEVSKKCAKLSFILSLPICIFYVIFSELIITSLLGDGYENVHVALKIFAISRLFMTLIGIPGAILTMSGNATLVGISWLVCLIFSISLGGVLSIYWGFIGMVIGMLIGEWLLNLFLCNKIKNKFNINSNLQVFRRKVPD